VCADRVAPGGRTAAALQAQAEQVSGALPPLLVAAERVAAAVFQGVHGRRRAGRGDSFWQYRLYQPGDNAEHIDWRQSAKGERVFVRENEWETIESVWLWSDASGSMQYRSRPDLPSKEERADLITLALASLLLRAGEHVALIGTTPRPLSGRYALSRLAHLAATGRADATGLPPPVALPRHAHVVLVGDFLSPLPETERVLRALAQRSPRGCLVQVLDPAEELLPFTGRTRFLGMENEGEALISRVETVREDYQEVLTAHLTGISDMCRALGWTHLRHRTDRPVQPTLLSLYMALASDHRRSA